MEFKLENTDIGRLRERIAGCHHMNHVQQVAFSTYHDCLTQICFGCEKVRTSMKPTDFTPVAKNEPNHSPEPMSTKQDKNEDLPRDTSSQIKQEIDKDYDTKN